jgi:hypothetical protein
LSLKALKNDKYKTVAGKMSELLVTTLDAYQLYQKDMNDNTKKVFCKKVLKAIQEDIADFKPAINQHRGFKGILTMFIRAILTLLSLGGAREEKAMFNTNTKNHLNFFSSAIRELEVHPPVQPS